MTTVFPMFQQHIEPHLVHAHLKIRNDFDPVHSPESSLFVLKSNKQVSYQEIIKVLGKEKMSSTVQHFTDIYLRLAKLRANGQLTESDCIRVRICEGRFALLIREVGQSHISFALLVFLQLFVAEAEQYLVCSRIWLSVISLLDSKTELS
jgi:hypothetical protein